jgi:hypothetical protein
MSRKRPFTPEELEARRLRAREYNARPEVKARKQEYNARPEVIARRKEYYRKPDVQERYKERIARGDQKEYMKQWRQSESGKRKLKEGGLRQRGFTLALWETLMSFQGGACAVCRKPFPENYRDIHADHCHEQQLPRGLLCQACNHAEGMIRKTGLSPEEFGRRLTTYLGNPPAARVGSEPHFQETLEERNYCDIR